MDEGDKATSEDMGVSDKGDAVFFLRDNTRREIFMVTSLLGERVSANRSRPLKEYGAIASEAYNLRG